MCGIVGVIPKNKYGFNPNHKDMFTHMLYCDAVRGFDSTGCFLVNKWGNVEWAKSKWNPAVLLGQKPYNDMLSEAFKNGRIMIGHNRKATHGEVTDENAHPFQEDNIILVHNGTIYNHKKHADVDVDSHAIAHLIKEKGNKEALKEIDGAFALVWYDINTKELYLARNDKRPLHLIETSGAWYISSENKLVEWMLSRQNIEKDIVNQFEIKPGKLYTFNIDSLEKYSEEDVELYSPKAAPQTVFPVTQYQGCHGKKWKNTGVDTGSTNQGTGIVIPHKKKDNPISFRFAVGETVVFTIDDYTNTSPSHLCGYDGTILGIVEDAPGIQVRCHFTNDEWLKISDCAQVMGELERIFSHGDIVTLWLKQGSLRNSWTMTSSNNEEINQQIWEQMPHKCFKCKDEVDFWELDDCIVHLKGNGKHKVFCPQCTTNITESMNTWQGTHCGC